MPASDDPSAAHPRTADADASSWSSVLADLEQGVGDAERLLDGSASQQSTPHWAPPSDLGPVPESLRMRAAILMERQAAVAQRLGERMAQTRRHRQVAARMSPSPGRPTAAYVDESL